MTISEEIPFTSEALSLYIKEATKEMDKLKPAVSQYNKLKARIKIARERLDKRSITQ